MHQTPVPSSMPAAFTPRWALVDVRLATPPLAVTYSKLKLPPWCANGDGIATEPAVSDALLDLAKRMGHTGVRAQDTPGFIVNHAGRAYGTEALARRVVAPFEGRPAYVLAAESVLLYKALAFRPKDRLDIGNVVQSQGAKLDRAYLESWARKLRIWSRLSPYLK